jgi:hypothetical protein
MVFVGAASSRDGLFVTAPPRLFVGEAGTCKAVASQCGRIHHSVVRDENRWFCSQMCEPIVKLYKTVTPANHVPEGLNP